MKRPWIYEFLRDGHGSIQFLVYQVYTYESNKITGRYQSLTFRKHIIRSYWDQEIWLASMQRLPLLTGKKYDTSVTRTGVDTLHIYPQARIPGITRGFCISYKYIHANLNPLSTVRFWIVETFMRHWASKISPRLKISGRINSGVAAVSYALVSTNDRIKIRGESIEPFFTNLNSKLACMRLSAE